MGARANKFMMALAMLSATAGAMLASAPEAEARGRYHHDICRSDRSGAMGRQMGERNAKRLFNQVFNRLGRSCAQLERLTGIIADTPLASQRSLMGACFAQGYVETLFNELDAAYIRCGDKCYMAGSDIGQISAQGYCAASAALGGLDDPGFIYQPALPFCGTNLVFGCKTEYVAQATQFIPGCRQFTEGYFGEIFDNTVRQDCYVPSDVPIRDVRGGGYYGYDFDSSFLF